MADQPGNVNKMTFPYKPVAYPKVVHGVLVKNLTEQRAVEAKHAAQPAEVPAEAPKQPHPIKK
jgi:hypothetical protein